MEKGLLLNRLLPPSFPSLCRGMFSRFESTTSVADLNKERNEFKPGFSFAKHGTFNQPQPQHQNSWASDGFLQSYIQHNLPPETFQEIQPDLHRFGERTAGEIWKLGRECEENSPYLKQYSAWGGRMDELVTCLAWKQQKSISAQEGLIAIPYQNKQGEYSRLYQCSKLFMYGPSSGLFSCPLAMTDAAAATIRALDLPLQDAFDRLTSRDPHTFWTSGQWMTEKAGGSDVGDGTETVAVHHQGTKYKLYGYKWFSSATDSDMTITLARTLNSQGESVPGSQGLSMFFLKTRRQDGSLNNIQIVKMKNKLGTRQLPTAELLLDGAKAELMSSEGRGISAISSMLTVTRLYNTIMSVGAMRKICSLSRDYATRRTAFKQTIHKHPLHVQTMARMEVETRGCCALMLDLARQLGLQENNVINDQDALLFRLMTPVAKLYTGKMVVAIVSEGLECIGGQGYIEDTGIPSMLRDAQVLPIWEGTTNVLSLDVIRAIKKTNGEVLRAFGARVTQITSKSSTHPRLSDPSAALNKTVSDVLNLVSANPELLLHCGRDLAYSLAQTYIAALLLQHAVRSRCTYDLDVAVYWMNRELAPVLRHAQGYNNNTMDSLSNIVYQNYHD